MATTKKRPIAVLVALLVLVLILSGTLVYGILMKKTTRTPQLALDLQGGTQLILTPKANQQAGAKSDKVGSEEINQAINVIRQRVDASGVAEAEITSQGSSNIMVSLPGNPSQDTLDLVRKSAELHFRSVLVEGIGQPQSVIDAATQQASADTDTTETPATGAEDPSAYAKQKADTNKDGKISTEPAGTPKDNSDLNLISEADYEKFYALDCTDPKNREGGDSGDPDKVLVACDTSGQAK